MSDKQSAAAVASAPAVRGGGDRAALGVLAVAVLLSGAMLAVAVVRAVGGGASESVFWATSSLPIAAAGENVPGTAAGGAALAADALPSAEALTRAAAQDADVASASTQPTAAAATVNEVPRHQRWELVFPAGVTEGDYAVQLDALGIELAVLWPDGQIEYATGLSQLTPMRRKSAAADEPRFYLSWAQEDLAAVDRRLLANVGIDAQQSVVLHFLTAAAETRLAELERMHAGRAAETVYRTRFGVRPSPSGYEFYVLEQQARG